MGRSTTAAARAGMATAAPHHDGRRAAAMPAMPATSDGSTTTYATSGAGTAAASPASESKVHEPAHSPAASVRRGQTDHAPAHTDSGAATKSARIAAGCAGHG